MAQKFSKGEAIKFGWNIMKDNLKFFIVLVVILFLVSFIPAKISENLKDGSSTLASIVDFLGWILTMIVSLGLIKIALRFVSNEKGEFSELFSQYTLLLKYLLAFILYSLIVFVGLILLIVPGIIWGVKYQFFTYFIVDKKAGPIEALKKSAEITKGAKWDLLIFGILLGLINLVGALCLFIGLFAAIPTTMIAQAFVYRKLLSYVEQPSMSNNPETAKDYQG